MTNGLFNKSLKWVTRPATLLALVCLSVFGLYNTSLDLKLYADDFAIWNTVLKAPDVFSLFVTTYVPEFYRPFELGLIRLNIARLGFHSSLYHLIAIAGHMLVCLTIYFLGRTLAFSRPAALLASLFFGMAHVNAISVMSNDGAGQIFSVWLGLLVMLLFLAPRDIRFFHSLAAGGLMFLLLLWKDSGVAFGPAAALILGWRLLLKGKARAFILFLLPILAAVALYFFIRHRVGIHSPGFGPEGRYQFWFGFNLIKNIAYLFAAMLTPVGTTILMAHRNDPSFIAIAAIGILTDLAVLGVGFRFYAKYSHGGVKRLLLAILLVWVLLLPDCLLNHVSEMYAYKPFTVFALLFTGAIVQIDGWARAKGGLLRALILLFLILTFACHIVSVKHKEHLMRHNGHVAQWMLTEIQSQVSQVPEEFNVLVSNLEPGPDLIYSIFVMHGVVVLGGGGFIDLLYDREPLDYRYAPPSQLGQRLENLQEPTLVITYGHGKVTARLFKDPPGELWF